MTHGDTDLIRAVRADDAARVRALLEAAADQAVRAAPHAGRGDGFDADARGADGLSALDIAVARGSYPVVQALREHGVRLDRVGPDGRTPLLRAVDAGAYAVTTLLRSSSVPLWPTGPDGRTALELARHWHETGAENELRRRTAATAATGPAELSRVPDDEYSFTGLLRLPGTGCPYAPVTRRSCARWRLPTGYARPSPSSSPAPRGSRAVRALVLLDDPRGEEALDRLGSGYPEDGPGYWSLYDAYRHLRLRRAAGARGGRG